MSFNYIILVIRKSCFCQRKLCNLLPMKKLHYLSSNPNTNLILGLVPLLPTVYAQKEEQNNKTIENNKVNKASTREPEKQIPVDDIRKDKITGWDGVRAIYKTDEFGNLSKELSAVLQSTFLSSFIGMIFGGANRSRVAYLDFMERNQASIFDSPLDAKRKLQNHVTMHFMRGAFHWGLKISSFTGGFMLFLVTMGAYRGSYNILDYSISGLVIGSLLKFRNGPRATVVGGTLGGVLGAFCGTMTNILFYLQGSSLDEMISFQYEIDKRRYQSYLDMKSKSEKEHVDSKALELITANDSKKIENPTI